MVILFIGAMALFVAVCGVGMYLSWKEMEEEDERRVEKVKKDSYVKFFDTFRLQQNMRR